MTPEMEARRKGYINGLEDAARIARSRKDLYVDEGPLEQLVIYLLEQAEVEARKIGWKRATPGEQH